jgi:HTH-type transcriptional regulator/antitoxin HigA
MNIKPIKTKVDYQDALKRLEMVFDAKPNTMEGDELEILGVLLDNYEKMNFQIDMIPNRKTHE